MGMSSGGSWKRWPPWLKTFSYIYKNVFFSFFVITFVFSLVMSKQQSSNNYFEARRLSYQSTLQEYNNDKMLRPKREISGAFNNVKSVPYCTWNAPLKTKYFTPYYEENREIGGCASTEKTSDGRIVHAIHLNTISKHILLTVEGKNNLFSLSLHLLTIPVKIFTHI